ncbi:MAG TPA: hypothetical protein VN039_05685 [Nitrospira sp.]|nr:hypothetical protein [Nitrospira sp.]
MATAEALMIDDPSAVLPQIPASGWLGMVGAVIVGGVLWLRRFLSNDSVINSANAAQTEIINLLRDQLAKESERADKAEAARNAAMQTIQQLEQKITDLTLKVSSLEQTVKAQNPATAGVMT